MSRQWAVTGIVVAGLALGAAALTWVAPEGAVEIDREAPNFRAVDLATRDSVSLEDYRGSVTLVNIWATWCVPCREEMPSMQRLYDSVGTRGFRIAAISIDEGSSEDVAAFARELDLSFDILHDRSGAVERLYRPPASPRASCSIAGACW